MKVVAFNGSARKGGNTSLLIKRVFTELESAAIETELVELGGQVLRGCTACMGCWRNQDGKCVIQRDPLNDYLQKMVEADGVILGSPTYFADVTAEMKALIDRAGMVNRASGDLLARKVGAGVVAVRRGGSMHTLQTLQNFFLIGQMIIPGSSYWNVAFGREMGEVEGDEEGMKTMADLGTNMAWLMKKLSGQ